MAESMTETAPQPNAPPPVSIPLPPCGHVDRLTQLTELAVMGAKGDPVYFLVCGVRGCPEYCRVYADLRDDLPPDDEFGGPGEPPEDEA